MLPKRLYYEQYEGEKVALGRLKNTYGHKKRSNALLQPLLTLNLIL